MLHNLKPTPKVMSAQPSALRAADSVGFAGSFLCAVHCAVLPLVLALLPAFSLKIGGWLDIDQAFVVFATLLGATTLTLGYRRHRVFRAWLWLMPGLGLVWLGAFTRLHNHTLTHAVVMTIGGLLLAAAHFINLRLTHAAAALPMVEE